MTVPVDPDPAPADPAPPVPGPPTKPKTSNSAVIVQSIIIGVVSVLAGKLAERMYPQSLTSGVVGAVVGGLLSGGLAVWFDRKAKAKARKSIPSPPENV